MTLNSKLEDLFLKSDLLEKDKYEIRQLYWLLTTEQKVNLINNFYSLEQKIFEIRAEIRYEQEILLWKALGTIESIIKDAIGSSHHDEAIEHIKRLKGNL